MDNRKIPTKANPKKMLCDLIFFIYFKFHCKKSQNQLYLFINRKKLQVFRVQKKIYLPLVKSYYEKKLHNYLNNNSFGFNN